MASSTLISSTSKFAIELSRNRECRVNSCVQVRASWKCSAFSAKMAKAGFGESSNFKVKLDVFKEKLWRFTPEPVKTFPWNEARDVLSERLLVTGGNALKWSLIALYVASFVSDFVFSVSRNWELMIPVGLCVGYFLFDLSKEVAQELVPTSQENKSKVTVLGISCFFVLVKVLSMYFTASKQVFLLHVSNGGLLQALWYWRNSSRENHEASENISVSQ